MFFMALNTKTKPIRNISKIFSCFICPMNRISCCANFSTILANFRFTQNFFNPIMQSSITNFIAFPRRTFIKFRLSLSKMNSPHLFFIFRILPQFFESISNLLSYNLWHIQISLTHFFNKIFRHLFIFVPRKVRTSKTFTSLFMFWRRIAFFKFSRDVIFFYKLSFIISFYHKCILSYRRLLVNHFLKDDGSIANASFTANERMEFDIGTVVGSVDWVAVSVTYTVDAD